MPNHSSGRFSVNTDTFRQWLSSNLEPTTVHDEITIIRDEADYGGVEQRILAASIVDGQIAPRPAPAEPAGLPPPRSPMTPHSSDSAAIRHVRDVLRSTPHSQWSASLVSLINTVTQDNRRRYCERHNITWRGIIPLTTSGGGSDDPGGTFGSAGGTTNTAQPIPAPIPSPFTTSDILWEPPVRSVSRSRPGSAGSQSNLYGEISSRDEGLIREPETQQHFFGNTPETTMTTVASQFGMRVNYPSIEKHPLIVGTHLAGVEIELENLAIGSPTFRYWTAKGDGSLRNNGMEFVCSHPWGGVDLYNAAVEIDSFLFGNNPDTTWRCSTHVHIDVRDMNVAQIKKMILAYMVYERVLFKCSGWQRYKNNFCVALGFAQAQLEDLGNWWSEPDSHFLNNLATRWDKYTAINFLPMGSFGSIEFRLGEAKWHKGQLIRLVNRFLSLKEVAVANADMDESDFLNMLLATDPMEIIRKGIPKGIGEMQADVEVGFKLAHDILSLAKLRRRHRRLFTPDLSDDSRQWVRDDFYDAGWAHCRRHLSRDYPNIDFPVHPGNTFNFKWLLELKEMMDRSGNTFDTEWFLPLQNTSQVKRLFNNYRAAINESRRPSAPIEFAEAVDEDSGEESWEESDF